MPSFSPYQTTAQNMDEVLSRDAEQRSNQGSRQLVSSELVSNGAPGTGTCKWGAKFTYADDTTETMWGGA